jgi:hypothetical protein
VLYNDTEGSGEPGSQDQAWEGSKVRVRPWETQVAIWNVLVALVVFVELVVRIRTGG